MTDLTLTPSRRAREMVRTPSVARAVTIPALAATVLNAAIWTAGRFVGVTYSVTIAVVDTAHHVSLLEIIGATVVLFVAGVGLVILAARRSRRAALAVGVAGVLFAVVSAGAAANAANDVATGAVLVSMHLVSGAVYARVAWPLLGRSVA